MRILSGLSVVFQPIFALDTVRVVGFEALGRGPRNAAPRELIERAHADGWLYELDGSWRRLAVDAIAASPLARSSRFFLNVDTRAMHDPRFVPEEIAALLASRGLAPERFVLELTEHDPELRGRRLRKLVRQYGAQGFRIALDDLGAGHASLAALVELEPSIVKLERTLVEGIWRSPIQRRLVEALLGFTAKMGMKLIAEGIDSVADLGTLRELGVRLGQGYLLGEPRPLAAWIGPEVRWCASPRRPRALAAASR
jgi:EAL domain-containing protein (putative c-di-GMP-specific phosphodiesterase class I)